MKLNVERPHGSSTLDNKPIIITFLAMEKSNFALYCYNNGVVKSCSRLFRDYIELMFINFMVLLLGTTSVVTLCYK